ncbi:MAG: hypothetical protein K0R44_3425 [Thermomicrobiales bacterium]|nr:hypothetical protein [Thermomicrobiales bacterium]
MGPGQFWRSCSQTGLFHSLRCFPPQMSLTRTSRRPCSARMRSRNELGRLLDGFRPGVFGLLVTRRPSGHIDRCACRTQLDRDAPTRAARPASDQGDLACKRHRPLRRMRPAHRRATPAPGPGRTLRTGPSTARSNAAWAWTVRLSLRPTTGWESFRADRGLDRPRFREATSLGDRRAVGPPLDEARFS